MRDILPVELAAQQAISARIEQTLATYGYAQVDLPIVESRDLYLRKLGEELVGKVYEFQFNNRELALRPEWTASVLRAYAARLQDQPLPLRLRYAGPVFRNERPQRGTYRQFQQVGVELIGAPSPRADAEALALACAGLDAAGVRDYRVRIGHIGLVRTVLARLNITDRLLETLVWSMERIRDKGVTQLHKQLLDSNETPIIDPDLLDGISDTQAEALLRSALETIGVNLQFGTRPPEAIVSRLVRKLRHTTPRATIEQALILLEALAHLHGPPDETLLRVEQLLTKHNIAVASLPQLAELRDIYRLSLAHGVRDHQVELNFGLGRGLNYYTGMIFEIYASDDLQLCGGGRYDDLVTALGGRQPTPAVGFAYGIERVVLACSPPVNDSPTHEVLVVADDDATYPYAIYVAQVLREHGFVTTLDLRARSQTSNTRDAIRRQLTALVFVGPEEQASTTARWRALPGRTEQRLALVALPHAHRG
jgi:histidyl-tRNA synthetase